MNIKNLYESLIKEDKSVLEALDDDIIVLDETDYTFDDATGNIIVPSSLLEYEKGEIKEICFVEDNEDTIHQYKITDLLGDDHIVMEYIGSSNDLSSMKESLNEATDEDVATYYNYKNHKIVHDTTKDMYFVKGYKEKFYTSDQAEEFIDKLTGTPHINSNPKDIIYFIIAGPLGDDDFLDAIYPNEKAYFKRRDSAINAAKKANIKYKIRTAVEMYDQSRNDGIMIWNSEEGFVNDFKELEEAANPENAEANVLIQRVLNGDSRAYDKLNKMGYDVNVDSKARKEFGRKYFGDHITVKNKATGREIYADSKNVYSSKDAMVARPTGSEDGWHNLKGRTSGDKADIRSFDFKGYLDKPYTKKEEQPTTVQQFKNDKRFLKDNEYTAKKIDDARSRMQDVRNKLASKGNKGSDKSVLEALDRFGWIVFYNNGNNNVYFNNDDDFQDTFDDEVRVYNTKTDASRATKYINTRYAKLTDYDEAEFRVESVAKFLNSSDHIALYYQADPPEIFEDTFIKYVLSLRNKEKLDDYYAIMESIASAFHWYRPLYYDLYQNKYRGKVDLRPYFNELTDAEQLNEINDLERLLKKLFKKEWYDDDWTSVLIMLQRTIGDTEYRRIMDEFSLYEKNLSKSIKESYDNPKEMGSGYTAPTLSNFSKWIKDLLPSYESGTEEEKDRAARWLKNLYQRIIERQNTFDEFNDYWKEKYQEANRLFKEYFDMFPVDIRKEVMNNLDNSLKESWTDIYHKFINVVDKVPLAEINNNVKELYDEHRGDPDWDKAYRKWLGINQHKTLKWLGDHETAWKDAEMFFKTNDLEEIDLDDLLDWIYDHDQLSQDFENYFTSKMFRESLTESISDLIIEPDVKDSYGYRIRIGGTIGYARRRVASKNAQTITIGRYNKVDDTFDFNYTYTSSVQDSSELTFLTEEDANKFASAIGLKDGEYYVGKTSKPYNLYKINTKYGSAYATQVFLLSKMRKKRPNVPERLFVNNSTFDESLNEDTSKDYTVEYYMNTATAERRPETEEDVEEDYIVDTFEATDDYDAALYAISLVRDDYDSLDELKDDYDLDSYDQCINFFKDVDFGDGSPFVVKLTQGSRVLYDSGLDKEYFLSEVEESDYDNEDDDDFTFTYTPKLKPALKKGSIIDELTMREDGKFNFKAVLVKPVKSGTSKYPVHGGFYGAQEFEAWEAYDKEDPSYICYTIIAKNSPYYQGWVETDLSKLLYYSSKNDGIQWN